MKRFVPNLITLGNLLCGLIATVLAAWGQVEAAAVFIGLGIFLDFFDGLAARLLKVSSELGKQLDSMADLVTSGVAPGLLLGVITENAIAGLLLPLFAAYRLAKFNIDTRQTHSFLGLPTPANAIFWAALGAYPLCKYAIVPLPIMDLHGPVLKWVCFAVSLLLNIAMVSEIPMLSLKFKQFTWKELRPKVIFLSGCLLLIVLFGLPGLSLSILFYILYSLLLVRKHD